MYRMGLLPSDFFSANSTWMQRGEDYRQLMEKVDIVNYYRKELWEHKPSGHLHYLESKNRPDTYVFLERTWLKVHKPGHPFVDSTKLAVEEAAALDADFNDRDSSLSQ